MPPLRRPTPVPGDGVPVDLGPVDDDFEYSVGGEANAYVFFRLAWVRQNLQCMLLVFFGFFGPVFPGFLPYSARTVMHHLS